MTQQRPAFPIKLDSLSGSKPKAKPAAAIPRPAVKAVPANPQGQGVGPVNKQALGMDSVAVRARMVQKLAQGGVKDTVVLQAMGAVERHRFVETALVNQAYEDTSLPIGLGQTISKPNVVARMIELLLEGKKGKLVSIEIKHKIEIEWLIKTYKEKDNK